MKNTAARKLKQVPQGYLVMGVDAYKKKHAAVAREDWSRKSRNRCP